MGAGGHQNTQSHCCCSGHSVTLKNLLQKGLLTTAVSLHSSSRLCVRSDYRGFVYRACSALWIIKVKYVSCDSRFEISALQVSEDRDKLLSHK